MTDLTINAPSFSLAPKSLDEALKFADVLAKSSIVPKDFNGNPNAPVGIWVRRTNAD